MPDTQTKILKLTHSLYPNGRAFKMPIGGVKERVHKALALSEARAYDGAFSVLNSTIPDNAGFTTDDATDWERRLGLISNPLTPLPDRILAILQKYNYPGTNAPRQHYLYLEQQLRAAGFDVNIYENNFSGVTQTPEQILGIVSGIAIHSTFALHGTFQHGGAYKNKIANYIEEDKDAAFVIGSNYRSTFFISSSTITTFAEVPLIRKAEFRQLILALKPVQTVGFLFVNYV